MSLSGEQSSSFFGPLKGKTSTFLVDGREANIKFARTVVGMLSAASDACAVLDLDAFYSSDSDLIFSPLGGTAAKSSVLRVPEPGSDAENELSTLFELQQDIIIVDSLNSLYHLISLDEGSSRSRKLAFAVASLSYLARTNGKTVIMTMYRREGFLRGGTGRSISWLSDVTASVAVRGSDLVVRVERGSAWPGGAFSTRIP
jgi:hypothetical protein